MPVVNPPAPPIRCYVSVGGAYNANADNTGSVEYQGILLDGNNQVVQNLGVQFIPLSHSYTAEDIKVAISSQIAVDTGLQGLSVVFL